MFVKDERQQLVEDANLTENSLLTELQRTMNVDSYRLQIICAYMKWLRET